MAGQVIAVLNMKGGVGETTVSPHVMRRSAYRPSKTRWRKEQSSWAEATSRTSFPTGGKFDLGTWQRIFLPSLMGRGTSA